ncbi:MAG: agmatine deiminase family protein [Candidatus Paceibacterota bacterium]
MENNTPKNLGFSMPAEWEKHSAVWLSWPHDTTSFPHLKEAEESFAEFIKEISTSEKVELQVLNEVMLDHVTELLEGEGVDMERVTFHPANYADIWFRDYGPIFITNPKTKELAMAKWTFNAWGNKYKILLKDNEIPYAMNAKMNLPMFEPSIVMEGGSIEVNGKGTLMTTEQCLLNKNRNPNLSREEIEKYLSDYLGVQHFIWLKEGIEGDDTDGHIDDIARFVNPTTVLCAYAEDAGSADHRVLKENYEILQNSKDQDGNPLTVIKLPTPGKISAHAEPLPASYANFYIGNTKVLVPTFGTENDTKALDIIQSVFPDRKVVGIDATYLVYGYGTFHCMSQQQPLP